MNYWQNLSRRGKLLISLALALVVALSVVYVNRVTVIVKLAGYAARNAFPVGPNQPVVWQNGGVWQGEGDRPPNIIVILTDDMGFNDVSYHGGGLIETPHIDRLAAEGVTFANGYAGSAVCSVSRAMLLTGRYSTRFGFEFTPAPEALGFIVSELSKTDPMPRTFLADDTAAPETENELTFYEKGVPQQEFTLAEELQQNGYRTLHVGKWHLGRTPVFRPSGQGFDESLFMESGLYLPLDHPDVVNAAVDFAIMDKMQWEIMTYAASFNDGPRFEPKGYLTDYYTDEAVKAIAANKDRPFFLFLSHWGIHTPLQASQADFDAVGDNFPDHRTRVYAAMIRAVDRSVGRVMDSLKEHGLDDNTLVIFTSDNGGANYIGLSDINKPYRGFKLSFFEGGTHVPFAMRWPGKIKPGTQFADPISHLDIMPTAMAAAGAKPQAQLLDGVNLLPHLAGRTKTPPHETIVWRSGDYQAILKDGWKLKLSTMPQQTRLYHLAADPHEKNNVSAAYPEKLAELRAALEAHNAQQAEPLWPSRVRMPIWVDKSLGDNPTLEDDYIYWPN